MRFCAEARFEPSLCRRRAPSVGARKLERAATITVVTLRRILLTIIMTRIIVIATITAAIRMAIIRTILLHEKQQ